jgi:hypothetical protein
MRQRKPYTGVLSEPVDYDEDGAQAKIAERFDALCRHYGIEEPDVPGVGQLVVRLARAHVPGLQSAVRARKGERPKKWTPTRTAVLGFS